MALDVRHLQFFESHENVQTAVAEVTGRTPNAGISRGIATCIQQGRLLFEAADSSAIQIRPLLLYYGALAYAKAIVCARTVCGLETLPQSHGLKDISAANAKLAELRVQVQVTGLFPKLNDAIRTFQSLPYYELAMSRRLPLPTAQSNSLVNAELDLKAILARIPELATLYSATYREEPDLLWFRLQLHGSAGGVVELRVDVPQLVGDQLELEALLRSLRTRVPALANWRLKSASRAWDSTVITFENADPTGEFTSPAFTDFSRGEFRGSAIQSNKYVAFERLLQPIATNATATDTFFVGPIQNQHVATFSIVYMGAYLLSSLVRYRPQTWVHSLSRFASNDRPSDDAGLALVEHFCGVIRSATEHVTLRALAER